MISEVKAREEAKRDRVCIKLYGPNWKWQAGLDLLAYARNAYCVREFAKYRMSLEQRKL